MTLTEGQIVQLDGWYTHTQLCVTRPVRWRVEQVIDTSDGWVWMQGTLLDRGAWTRAVRVPAREVKELPPGDTGTAPC